MKKWLGYICLTGLTCVTVITMLTANVSKEPDIGNFELTDYQSKLEEFPFEGKISPNSSPNEIVKQAGQIWEELFGKDVRHEKPYQLFYDANNRVWLVTGTLPFWYDVGGVAHMLIEEDTGEILAIWHEK